MTSALRTHGTEFAGDQLHVTALLLRRQKRFDAEEVLHGFALRSGLRRQHLAEQFLHFRRSAVGALQFLAEREARGAHLLAAPAALAC